MAWRGLAEEVGCGGEWLGLVEETG